MLLGDLKMKNKIRLLAIVAGLSLQLSSNITTAAPLKTDSKQAAQQIIFIDTRIKNYQHLLNDVKDKSNKTMIIKLSPDSSAIKQITQTLKQHQQLDAIHLITHGFSGGLRFNNEILDQNALWSQQHTVAQWGNALTEHGDILLYGCNIANSKTGIKFINTFSKLTQADVNASSNITGNPSTDSDWLLEESTGKIDIAALFDNKPSHFQGRLKIEEGLEMGTKKLTKSAFLYGNNIEVGIGTDGAIGADILSPSGQSKGKALGYISDRTKNSFSSGDYDGDFFMPQRSEEGWGIRIGNNKYNNNSSIQYGPKTPRVKGRLKDFINKPDNIRKVTWEGQVDGVTITQVFRIYTKGISVIIDVTLKNTTTKTLHDIYYMRTVDPDNNYRKSQSFVTTNTIMRQGSLEGGAAVKAEQDDGSLLGLCGHGANSRVAYGNKRVDDNTIFYRDPKLVYSAFSTPYLNGEENPLKGEVGKSHTADESIGIAFKFKQIEAGKTVKFRVGYQLADIDRPQLDLDTTTTGSSFNQIYTLGSDPIPITHTSTSIQIRNEDRLSGLTIKLLNPHKNDKISLSGELPSDLSYTENEINDATEINIQGTISKAVYNTLLKQFHFSNISETSNTETRHVSIHTLDTNHTNSNSAISKIQIITPIHINTNTLSDGDVLNHDNEKKAILSGTAAPNAHIVVVFTDSANTPTSKKIKTDANGHWSLLTDPADLTRLKEGTIKVTVTATDGNGNSTTKTLSINKDTEAQLDIISPKDKATSSSATPVFIGKSDPKSNITLTIDGKKYTTPADDKGHWKITLPLQKLATTLAVLIEVKDTVGNQNKIEQTLKIPALPIKITDLGTDEKGLASSTAPTVTGTSEPGTKITVTAAPTNGAGTPSSQCTAITKADGTWSCTLPKLPAGGPYTVTAKTDDGTNSATISKTISIPKLSLSITSPKNNDILSGRETLISGTSEVGSEISIKTSATSKCTATTDANQQWQCKLSSLPLGKTITINAIATDKVNNKTEKTLQITTKTLPLSILSPEDKSTTNNTAPLFTGTTHPKTKITISLEGSDKSGTTTSNEKGQWFCQMPALPTGQAHSIKIKAEDKEGNITTLPYEISIPKLELTITEPANSSSISGTTPTISGTSTPKTQITVTTLDKKTCETITDTKGNWSCTLPSLPLGESVGIEVSAKDGADNHIKKALQITTKKLPLSLITPSNNSTLVTNAPSFTGIAAAGNTVTVTFPTNATDPITCTATADEQGKWSCQMSKLPNNKTYQYTVKAEDGKGNTTTIKKQLTTPELPLIINSPRNNAAISPKTPTVAGTSQPKTKITVTTSNNENCTTTTDSSNHWQCELPNLPLESKIKISVTSSDNEGNQASQSVDVLTTKLPLTIISPNNNGIANNTKPLFIGTSTPGTTVTVKAPTGEFCTAKTDKKGHWSCQLPVLAIGGPYAVTISVVDPGNNTTTKITQTITIPKVPLVITSPTQNEKIGTSDLNVTGSTDPNTTVTVFGHDGEKCTTLSDEKGAWQCLLIDIQSGDPKYITVISGDKEDKQKTAVVKISIENASKKVATILKGGAGSLSFGLLFLFAFGLWLKKSLRNKNTIK